MNDKELKKLLENPKKLLDLLSLGHTLLHLYEAQQMRKPGTQEKMGLKDSLDIQLNHREVNK